MNILANALLRPARQIGFRLLIHATPNLKLSALCLR